MEQANHKELFDSAWKYFQLHANQRVTHFNFFIVISTALISGTLSVLHPEIKLYRLSIGLGLIQVLLAFLFWRLELRNKELVKHAEKVLKAIEKKALPNSSSLEKYSIFCSEQIESNVENSKHFVHRFMKSHGQIYKSLYFSFGLIGISLIIFSIALSVSTVA